MSEGAIINVERGRVRFREDADGMAYELRPSASSGTSLDGGDRNEGGGSESAPLSRGLERPVALDVYRVDENKTNGESSVFLGRLVYGRQGWRPEMVKRDRLREQLVVIARAWNRALVLKK